MSSAKEYLNESAPIMLTAGKMAPIFGLAESTLHRLLTEAGLQNQKGVGFNFHASIKATVSHFKNRSEQIDTDKELSLARKAKHDANIAEVKEMQIKELLVFKADAMDVWADATVQVRKEIEGADYLPAKGRERLLKELLKIKLADFSKKDSADESPEDE